MGDKLTDREELAAFIRERLARELGPVLQATIGPAVREALAGADLGPARQGAAKRAQAIEQRESAEAASANAERLHEARVIAARTIWERVPQASGGGGFPRPTQLIATGLPEPLAYVPLLGDWRERR